MESRVPSTSFEYLQLLKEIARKTKLITALGILASPHHSDTPVDGTEQHQQLPGHPDQGHGGGGLVGVRVDDQERGGVRHGAVRVPGVGEKSHHQQQEDQSQCYR